MDFIKSVKTYRLTPALDQRLRLAEEIYHEIKSPLHDFIIARINLPAADDIFQEVVQAVTKDLTQFKGDSDKEFWAWCYGIARFKVLDHLRKQKNDRLQPMEPEELGQLVDTSAQSRPLSPEDRMDLQHALKILAAAKPECLEFLWQHYVLGFDYSELAEEHQSTYDSVRMKIGRCLDTAQALMA